MSIQKNKQQQTPNKTKRQYFEKVKKFKKTRKISSKQSNLTPKETRERRTNKTQS